MVSTSFTTPSRTEVLGLLTVIMILGSSGQIFAQDFDEWAEKRQRQFEDYRTEREKKFRSYLKERWEKMRVFAGEREDPVPKPVEFPVASESDTVSTRELNVKSVVRQSGQRVRSGTTAAPEPPVPSETRSPSRQESDRAQPREQFSVTFLGESLEISEAAVLKGLRLKEVSAEGITDFWSEFSKRPTAPLLDRLSTIADNRQLDGWGYLQLVQSLADERYEDDRLATVVSWGLLLKSGYQTRLGYQNNTPYLLLRTETMLYEVPYFELDGRRFFVYAQGQIPELNSLRTYRKNFPGELDPLTISLGSLPEMPENPRERSLSFDFRNRTYEFDVTVNGQAVEYLKSLPQLPLAEYFRVVNRTTESGELLRKLERRLRDVDRSRRLEFLLRFVQTAFEYKTDGEQFGSENFMLPVETLYYPYSDCEDRALLFATLVQNLLERQVVGLDYPGHVATAVQGSESLRGSYLKIKRSRFFIADPTYMNADPGMVMPRYKDETPEVILIDDI